MQTTTKIFSALGAAGIAALLVWAFTPRATEVEVAQLRVGTFERSVAEIGKTRLQARYVLSAPVSGQLERILLQEGDLVARDAVLARLTPATPALQDERTLQEQRERVGAMEANLERASANIERAQLALAQAQADLKRSQTLSSQGFVSPTQSEAGKLTVALREKDLQAARLEAHAARHSLDEMRLATRRFASGQGGTRAIEMRAPVAGKVLKILRDSEGLVSAGTALLEVGDPTRLEVQADLLTEDAAQVRPGARATLSNWGGTQDLSAQVRRVEPAAFTKVSALGVEEQRVQVVLDIASPGAQWQSLGDGFKTDVRIVVQTQEQALMAPVSALFPSGQNAALLVVQDGRARRVELKVLARNGKDAWLQTDLAAGTTVVVYPPSQLQDGDRVRTAATR